MPKPDLAKERHWRAVIADWTASGLGMAEYCRRREISAKDLHNWTRRLRERDKKSARMQDTKQRASRSTTGGSQGRKRANGGCAVLDGQPIGRKAYTNSGLHSFAEIQVSERGNTEALVAVEQTFPIEIVCCNGRKVRLATGCPLDLLSSVIILLENH